MDWSYGTFEVPGLKEHWQAWSASSDGMGFLCTQDPAYPHLGWSCSVRPLGDTGKPQMIATGLQNALECKGRCEDFLASLRFKR